MKLIYFDQNKAATIENNREVLCKLGLVPGFSKYELKNPKIEPFCTGRWYNLSTLTVRRYPSPPETLYRLTGADSWMPPLEYIRTYCVGTQS